MKRPGGASCLPQWFLPCSLLFPCKCIPHLVTWSLIVYWPLLLFSLLTSASVALPNQQMIQKATEGQQTFNKRRIKHLKHFVVNKKMTISRVSNRQTKQMPNVKAVRQPQSSTNPILVIAVQYYWSLYWSLQNQNDLTA